MSRAVNGLAASYVVRMVGVTAGYHRYFSHRAYKLGRAPQLLLAAVQIARDLRPFVLHRSRPDPARVVDRPPAVVPVP
jgi:hypothetical protein